MGPDHFVRSPNTKFYDVRRRHETREPGRYAAIQGGVLYQRTGGGAGEHRLDLRHPGDRGTTHIEPMSTNKAQKRGLTLIETMVAIALLMLALIPPMSLASQALTSAFYARNQITAFYLAQEGIEIVRAVRDANIIALAEGNSSVNIFDNIPHGASL